MSIQVRVLEGFAATSPAAKRFREKLETQFKDAGIEEHAERGEMAFYFAEGLVVFRERVIEADGLQGLIAAMADPGELDGTKILACYDDEIVGEPYQYRVILGEGLMEHVADMAFIAKLLFEETGTLGAAEMGMVSQAVLDFGENQWVVSPVGVLLVGKIEDIRQCLYLIGQTMVGVATYMAVADELEHQLYEAPKTFTEAELSIYESALEELSDTTSFVINDVRDEMLNADPQGRPHHQAAARRDDHSGA